MDLLRAAYLLEAEIADLQNLPSWKRRELENIGRASIRAMREAAERIERLESLHVESRQPESVQPESLQRMPSVFGSRSP